MREESYAMRVEIHQSEKYEIDIILVKWKLFRDNNFALRKI